MKTKSKKILIVDDDPDLVSSLARILKLQGFQVDSAFDGAEAVEKNLSWEPDAVIMDVRMPRLNGIDACLAVQKARENVLVILITGFSQALDEANQTIFAEAGRSPRVEVMLKPLDLDRVTALLGIEDDPSLSLAGRSVVDWLETTPDRPARRTQSAPVRSRIWSD